MTAGIDTGPSGGVTPAPATNGIVVEGLVREFGSHRAVDGIDLHVDPGEIYGFLGPNGAGKSTTVHMLTTLLPPTGGRARVCGFDITADGPRLRGVIGVALQAVALDPLLSGREHMTLQMALDGIPKAERKAWAESLLDRVGLTDAAERKTGTYSGGMKRRLDLALALVKRPQVLFLDEPTTGLDPQSRTALWAEVARMSREEGVTIFLTTQYLEEADQLANRVGIIESGHIVAEGTPAQLKAEIGRPTLEAVPAHETDAERVTATLSRFGNLTGVGARKGITVQLREGVDGLADIVRALDSQGLRLSYLSLQEPTLDDVFLIKTGRSLEGAAQEAEEAGPGEAAVSLPGTSLTAGGGGRHTGGKA